LPLDLASAVSVIKFAELLPDEKIDMLICNAGLIATKYEQTMEGLETTVGICHYGHFLLTKLLMPRLLRSGLPRVVMVSSESHRSPKTLDFDRFPLTREDYSMMIAYGQAKLANVLMANELQRRYGEQGLVACSLHPGTLITTNIGRQAMWMRALMILISPFTKSPNQGAATSVYCATEADPQKVAGLYFQDCQPVRMSREAQDVAVAGKLWDISEKWAGQILTSQA
jgi:WW domain-containing oxidoreductase